MDFEADLKGICNFDKDNLRIRNIKSNANSPKEKKISYFYLVLFKE